MRTATMTLYVEVQITVTTTIAVEAGSPQEAADLVDQGPIPNFGDWSPLDDWRYFVTDDSGKELFDSDSDGMT